MLKEKFENNPMDILLLDPDKNSLEGLNNLLTNRGFKTIATQEFRVAMELLIMNNPKVVITEIMKPGSEGIEILRALRRIRTDSVIIIHTNKVVKDSGYEKRFGLVFDFLHKPANQEILMDSVQKALEFYSIKLSKLNYNDNFDETIKEQLEWLIWKEQKSQGYKQAFGKSIIETIVHSIFQGMGVGSMIPLIDLLELGLKEEGEYSKVKTKIVKSLIKNAHPLRTIKEKLDYILKVFDKEFKREVVPGQAIKNYVLNSLEAVEKLREIKNHKVRVENLDFPFSIYSNVELLELSIRELLTNAFKYSTDNSTIYITKSSSQDTFSIIILNSILMMKRGITGVPPEFEYEIFEPFFKINHIYDERFYEEELGFGVGLSVIQTNINKIGGKVHVYEILDHVTSSEPQRKVAAELVFPIIKN
ncbi:MAG: response regulator [Leptospiraceae bacterium]|nr:response regulator [Leptospiraceae bacterium]MCP5495221.1 response regulator [Leptospiraceae bacterium]